MHQLRRLYVNYAVIHYSSLLLYPTDYIATSRYFYLITDGVLFGFPRFSSLFIFFAMRFAYRVAGRLLQGKVLP
jgi:hypothetical protein